MRKILLLVVTTFFLPGIVLSAQAAEYPSKPVTIIVPMAPGGARDLQCRAFAAFAEKTLGKPFVVVNKPGASGMIGMLAGAQAAPDGHTLTGSSTSDIGAVEWELANGRKPAVTRHDFVPLGTFTVSPTLVAVPYNSPWKTVADLVREVKAKPGHYAFCSGGMYNATHLSAEVFIRATGLKVRHVPYPGGGASVSALVGGHGDFGCPSISSSLYLARGNKLRILAVQSDKRCRLIPDIPTVKELGIDAEFPTWQGILAPAKTPRPIVDKLQNTLEKASQDKGFIQIIEGQGDDVIHLKSDEMAKYLEEESARFAKLLRVLMAEEKAKK